ncbi:MAG TPA: tetratricopeptide repeat protein [Vicinamibacterales bacterium]
MSANVSAQKDPFIDAFIAFHSNLAGTYGDEGRLVASSLEEMAARLAAWEAETRKAETELKAQSPQASSDLALLYLDAGRRDDALTAIEAAIQIEPKRAAFHMFRGLIVDASGRDAEAVRSFTVAANVAPEDPIAAYALVARLAGESNQDDIQPQIATLLSASRRARPTLRAPFIPVALIDDRAAETPIFSPAQYSDGFTSIAHGRYQEAIARFRTAFGRDPLMSDPASRSEEMAEGIAALRQRRVAAAIERLESAAASWPKSSEAHRILGAAYAANRNHMQSVAHLDTAVRLAPRDERARVALGRELADAGKTQDAERSLRETIAMLPSSGQARWALADLYERAGRGLDAIRELEAAATLTVLAGKGRLYWRIATLAYLVQDFDRVSNALFHRARLIPNEAGAHKDLGLAYNRAGRQDQALAELIMASLLGFEDSEMLGVIGQIHLNAGRYTAAEEVLRRAVAQQPDSAQAHYTLGSTLLRLGKTDEAKVELAEFQRLRTAATEDQRRTFELELRKREEDLGTPGAGR